MEHFGVDLGASKSRVCVLSEMGEVVLEREIGTRRLGAFFAARSPSRVLMETCAESARVAEQAKAAGHDVVVVPGKLLRQLGIGDRGIKTDIRDARTLALASRRLPELRGVHLRSASALRHGAQPPKCRCSFQVVCRLDQRALGRGGWVTEYESRAAAVRARSSRNVRRRIIASVTSSISTFPASPCEETCPPQVHSFE